MADAPVVVAPTPSAAPATSTPDTPVTAQTAAPVSEPKVEVNTDFTKKLASLAKKERSFAEKEAEITRKEGELKSLQARIEAFEAAKKEAKTNPHKALEELGLSNADLISTFLTSQPDEPTTPEAREVRELRKKMESLEKAETERQERIKQHQENLRKSQEAELAKADQAKLDAYLDGVFSTAKSNPDKYEFTLAENDRDLVHEVAEQWAQKNRAAAKGGKYSAPTAEQVLDKIEKFYEDRFAKLVGSKKFATLGKTPAATAEKKPEGGGTPPAAASATAHEQKSFAVQKKTLIGRYVPKNKTLSNSLNSAAPTAPAKKKFGI